MKFQQPVNRGKVFALLAKKGFGFDLTYVGKTAWKINFSKCFFQHLPNFNKVEIDELRSSNQNQKQNFRLNNQRP